jgi:hypothetical protein
MVVITAAPGITVPLDLAERFPLEQAGAAYATVAAGARGRVLLIPGAGGG